MRLIYLKPGQVHIIEDRMSKAVFETDGLMGPDEVNYLMSYDCAPQDTVPDSSVLPDPDPVNIN